MHERGPQTHMLKNSSVSRSDSKFFDGTNAVMPEIAFLFRGEYEVIIIGSCRLCFSISRNDEFHLWSTPPPDDVHAV